MKDIDGFLCKQKVHRYVVRKALYGLRQAGREWNDEYHEWMTENMYLTCLTEPCLYYLHDPDGTILLVLVYVDDVLTFCVQQTINQQKLTCLQNLHCSMVSKVERSCGVP